MDNKQLWENVLVDIELNISKANFSTWFKDTHITKFDAGVVYLNVPNEFVKDWLFNKYHKFIVKALRGFSEGVRGLEYVIKKDEKKKDESLGSDIKSGTVIQINGELPLQDYYINKNDNLNPRYTFDTFVVGAFNELAHAAAQAIVQKPGIAYNPLFIYGNVGHGKTHLIQAVGNQLKKLYSGKKVYYVTSEKFTVDYINAVQTTKVNSFKEKYRQYDVLIMDDIQFLSNKEKTQEELFHLFNALYDNNKQIIFSSDRHPNYIPNLEERLKSRFAAGMIVDIPQPEYESRIAILKSKTKHSNFLLSDDVIEFLAVNIQGNIRDLEGALNSIICQSQLKGKVLTIQEIKNLIKNNAKPKKSISAKDVIKKVADFYNIEENSIYEKTRRKEVVKPRQVIMYILREDFSISYPAIGEKLGGRDHTTVIHSCEKVRNELKVDNTLSQELSQIRTLIG
ncbi:chromosomal replication initiator protein DnaA [Patescibacteria group bacterium]|nr:chromosomal replication initiator protein DnaA [Patescibacteria group bacterium]